MRHIAAWSPESYEPHGSARQKEPGVIKLLSKRGQKLKDKGKEYKWTVQTYTGDCVSWHQYKLMDKYVYAERRQGGI